ncbi:SH3 domain-containing protein [Oceanirhabdus seepicola]|uniref:SH3 domain-containing protein n=1 Tax=Oceanirhabdus seepicola TaxID=2828781 RepID=A0A9J6P7A7_9CLOT|nr:SH3 domain-containing protein [Oceanirhabdus seepicola]MCM1992794.1 SH3 domain-containing protein [Oceanirhabdus seepicola]
MSNLWIEFGAIIFITSLISIILLLKIFIKPLLFIFKIVIAILTSILYKIASIANGLRGLSDFSDNIASIFNKKSQKSDSKKKVFRKSLLISIGITVISLFLAKQSNLDITKYQYFTKLMNIEYVKDFIGNEDTSNTSAKSVENKWNHNFSEDDLVYLNSSAKVYEYDENKKVLTVESKVQNNNTKAYKDDFILVKDEYFIKIIFDNGEEFFVNPKDIIKTSKYAIVNAKSLNLRKEPKVSKGNIYCAIHKNEKVNVIYEDISEEWILVSTGEYAGFVYSKYIDISTNTE